MEEWREARRTRLPPPARSRIEAASSFLDGEVLRHLHTVRRLMVDRPIEAALALMDAQAGVHKALAEMAKACNGVAGAEERRTVSAANTDRPKDSIERT